MSTRKHEPEELTDLVVRSLKAVLLMGSDSARGSAARLVLEKMTVERKAITSFEARLAAVERKP